MLDKLTIRVARTPWKHRLIVWPGEPFRTWPFPYLFHRWDVNEDQMGWFGGFWTKKEAIQNAHNYEYEFRLIPEAEVEVIVS